MLYCVGGNKKNVIFLIKFRIMTLKVIHRFAFVKIDSMIDRAVCRVAAKQHF